MIDDGRFDGPISSDFKGESILHLWIEKFRGYLQSTGVVEDVVSQDNATETCRMPLGDSECSEMDEACPAVTSSERFTDRKSKFQGHAARVTSVAQVK